MSKRLLLLFEWWIEREIFHTCLPSLVIINHQWNYSGTSDQKNVAVSFSIVWISFLSGYFPLFIFMKKNNHNKQCGMINESIYSTIVHRTVSVVWTLIQRRRPSSSDNHYHHHYDKYEPEKGRVCTRWLYQYRSNRLDNLPTKEFHHPARVCGSS